MTILNYIKKKKKISVKLKNNFKCKQIDSLSIFDFYRDFDDFYKNSNCDSYSLEELARYKSASNHF